MIRRFVFAAAFVLGLTLAPPTAARGGDSVQTTLVWHLDLGADGAIGELTAVSTMPDLLRDKLEAEIRTWSFRSGKIGGSAAPSQTSLNLRVRGDRQADGTWSVTLLGAETGGRMRKMIVPQYPEAAIASRRQGLVLLLLEYDADGKVTSSTVADASPIKTGNLIGAARGASKRYEFEPERVGGRAVAGSALLPVCFTIRDLPGAPVGNCAWTRPGDAEPLEDVQAVALGSMVTIETDVAGRML